MSTTAILLKLPCILVVNSAVHRSLTTPGTASKGEVLPVYGFWDKVTACGVTNYVVGAQKVRWRVNLLTR